MDNTVFTRNTDIVLLEERTLAATNYTFLYNLLLTDLSKVNHYAILNFHAVYTISKWDILSEKYLHLW